MKILSIQSWVCYGHVGNAAAIFPLQRMGAEVWAVNTVQFSNHTGYGDWQGQSYSGSEIGKLVDGIAARKALQSCDAVLSGYMGDPSVGKAIVNAVRRVKEANPDALYCCDPVIGDEAKGPFVKPGVAEFLGEEAIKVADILTPNKFELEQLTRMPCKTLNNVKQAVLSLHDRGPRVVLVSGLRTEQTPKDQIDMLVSDSDAFFVLRTPRLPMEANGAGDVMAALVLYHLANGGSAAGALEATGSSLFGLLDQTARAKAKELLLIDAQEEFVQPSRLFMANPC